jgi:hypothetical protein
LYYENPKLVYAKKAYLNTPEECAAFERVSGLRIAALPEFPSTALPKRDEKSAQQFIVAAKTPFQVRMADDTYTDESTGEVKPTKKFAGFYEPPTGTQPDNIANPDFSPADGKQDSESGKEQYGQSTLQVYTKETAEKDKRYMTISGATLWSREPFRALGFDEHVIEQLGQVGEHILPHSVTACYVQQGVYKSLIRLRRDDTGEVVSNDGNAIAQAS